MTKKTLLIATFFVLITVVTGAVLVNANTEAEKRVRANPENSQSKYEIVSVPGYQYQVMVKNLFSIDIFFPIKTKAEAERFIDNSINKLNTEYSNILSFRAHNNLNSTATCYPVINGRCVHCTYGGEIYAYGETRDCTSPCSYRRCSSDISCSSRSITLEGERTCRENGNWSGCNTFSTCPSDECFSNSDCCDGVIYGGRCCDPNTGRWCHGCGDGTNSYVECDGSCSPCP